MKEQIEEMAKEICLATQKTNYSCNKMCKKQGGCAYCIVLAEHLCNADYRKQSENTVELPCKVGQTVYVPWRYGGQRGVATVIVQEIKLYDTNPSHCMFFIDMESDNECFNQSFGGWKTEQCIGKTVFLTLEEAETALRK